MTDALILLAGAAALIWTAFRAYARPDGVYWRSAAGAIGVALIGGVLWQLASPSAEGGLGAFVLWCAVVALALVFGAVASVAATARHIVNALTESNAA